MWQRRHSAMVLGLLAVAGCTSSADADDRLPPTMECVLSYRADPDAAEEHATVEVERVRDPDGTTGSFTFGEGTSEELTFEVTYRSSVSDAELWTRVSSAEDLVRQWFTRFGETTNLHLDPYGEEGVTGIEEASHRGAALHHYCQGVA